jgi:hypothetical protein
MTGTGNPHLDHQISTVTTLLRIASSKAGFEDLLERVFAKQMRLPLVTRYLPPMRQRRLTGSRRSATEFPGPRA